MNWLLDPAPATKLFSNAESILVASQQLRNRSNYFTLAQQCTIPSVT
jgi:hypothetical protein